MRGLFCRTGTVETGRPPRQAGFTLFELVVVVGTMLAVMGGVCTIIFQTGRLFNDQVSRYTIDEAGRHLIDRLADDLRGVEPTTIKPLAILDSEFLTFQRVIGFVDGAPQLSFPATLEFQLAAGEKKNGKDDNGDGRIDEGFLVHTQLGGAPIRIAGNVLSVKFNPILNGISFTVTLAITDHGRLIQKSFYSEVFYRN